MRARFHLPVVGVVAALSALLTLPACGPKRPAGAPQGWPSTADWILHGDGGQPEGFEALISDLEDADVVFIGENHDDPLHHEVQRRIIEALLARRSDLAIGMEMLQTPSQPALDRWVEKKIDLDTFLQESRWERVWGFPIALYLPIFELARRNDVRIFALNAPEEMVRRLSEVGLDGLSPEERDALPELDLEDEAHMEFVRKAFSAHHALPEDRFQRFYAVQVLWDETMAERTVLAMRSRPDETVVEEDAAPIRFVVVLAGTGHLVRRMGIPSRVERRVPEARTRVVLSISAHPGVEKVIEKAIRNEDADWFWITPAR